MLCERCRFFFHTVRSQSICFDSRKTFTRPVVLRWKSLPPRPERKPPVPSGTPATTMRFSTRSCDRPHRRPPRGNRPRSARRQFSSPRYRPADRTPRPRLRSNGSGSAQLAVQPALDAVFRTTTLVAGVQCDIGDRPQSFAPRRLFLFPLSSRFRFPFSSVAYGTIITIRHRALAHRTRATRT